MLRIRQQRRRICALATIKDFGPGTHALHGNVGAVNTPYYERAILLVRSLWNCVEW